MKPLIERKGMETVEFGNVRKALPIEIRPTIFIRLSEPKGRIFAMHKTVAGVENTSRSMCLLNADGEVIKNHIIPIFPEQRRLRRTMAETSPRDMHVGNIPKK
jgi:hypothetical protein